MRVTNKNSSHFTTKHGPHFLHRAKDSGSHTARNDGNYPLPQTYIFCLALETVCKITNERTENNENARKLESFATEKLTELFAEYLAERKTYGGLLVTISNMCSLE